MVVKPKKIVLKINSEFLMILVHYDRFFFLKYILLK